MHACVRVIRYRCTNVSIYVRHRSHRAIPTTFNIVSIALACPHAEPPHASFKRRDSTSRQWCWPGCSGCPGIPRRRACSSDDQQPAAFKPKLRQQPGDDRVGAGWRAGVGCWREVFGNVALSCTCMRACIHTCVHADIHAYMHAPTHPRLLVYMRNAADLRCGVVRRGAGHLLTRTALATPVWSCHHSRPHQRRRLKRSLYVTLLLILANAADRPSVQAKTLCVMGMTPTSPLPRRPHFRLWASLNPSTWLKGVCGCANR